MSKESILIVEDDPHISQLVRYNLEKAGYECYGASTGEEALKILKTRVASLIILDVMLPQMDGFEVCRSIKRDPKLQRIAIIMLTAKGEEVDRVVGLELGADDYMVKPFSPRELILRIKAILRRLQFGGEEIKKDVLKAGELMIDISKHRVTIQEKEVELTPMEFKLLSLLVERRGRVQTRERLLSDVWDIHAEIDTRTVDTHIKRLREKMGKMEHSIETVRGMGYRFKE
ncbi:MAG: response regulator transcription factor [Chlamydiae bacterium]|nr:response regulator transcription factor [Chlamydiota bacterium]MBI3277099.1 response regulator transcription factor [Chlamydiota bacterium]